MFFFLDLLICGCEEAANVLDLGILFARSAGSCS
jgi:hypothetical protein